MVSQHDPAQPLDLTVSQSDRPDRPDQLGGELPSANARLETALCLALVSTCPLCGAEHVMAIPATRAQDGPGWMHFRIGRAGPLSPPLSPPSESSDETTLTRQRYSSRPPQHAYVTRILRSTVARAIERDMPRRLWWPFVRFDEER